MHRLDAAAATAARPEFHREATTNEVSKDDGLQDKAQRK